MIFWESVDTPHGFWIFPNVIPSASVFGRRSKFSRPSASAMAEGEKNFLSHLCVGLYSRRYGIRPQCPRKGHADSTQWHFFNPVNMANSMMMPYPFLKKPSFLAFEQGSVCSYSCIFFATWLKESNLKLVKCVCINLWPVAYTFHLH